MRPARNYLIEVDHPVSITGPDGRSFAVDLSPDRPDYVTCDGVEVWMERKGQKTRFLDAAGEQVGPVHANLVPAVVWARHHGWRDPTSPDWWNDGVIDEVRRESRSFDDRDKDAGRWLPNQDDGTVR